MALTCWGYCVSWSRVTGCTALSAGAHVISMAPCLAAAEKAGRDCCVVLMINVCLINLHASGITHQRAYSDCMSLQIGYDVRKLQLLVYCSYLLFYHIDSLQQWQLLVLTITSLRRHHGQYDIDSGPHNSCAQWICAVRHFSVPNGQAMPCCHTLCITVMQIK